MKLWVICRTLKNGFCRLQKITILKHNLGLEPFLIVRGIAEAKRWFKASAEKGHLKAKNHLAALMQKEL
jgi:hypothetical protein